MASLTVRNIPEEAKLRFRQVAAAHGRSMEEHLRQLVIAAGTEDEPGSGVRDMKQQFRHAQPEDKFVSSGSPVIDDLLRLGRGLEFDVPKREVEQFEDLFDPKDYL